MIEETTKGLPVKGTDAILIKMKGCHKYRESKENSPPICKCTPELINKESLNLGDYETQHLCLLN